jgi:hypothetical protein
MKKTLLNLGLAALFCVCATAQYKVIWNFGTIAKDGADPSGNLLADATGNLYGTTTLGGSSSACNVGCGTVFELSPQPNGTWQETILHNFCVSNSSCSDGSDPQAGLVMDAKGNLYGTTNQGGLTNCPIAQVGCGVVFELSPPSLPGTAWTYTVLHNFCSIPDGGNCADGALPKGPVAFDSAGNLYGTTSLGGNNGAFYTSGTIFELSPGANGWIETVLYKFCSVQSAGICTDGGYPIAGVTLDKAGNLLGTTFTGGASNSPAGAGTVYKLSREGGAWKQSVLYTAGTSLFSPRAFFAPVTLDSVGNIYFTFAAGGRIPGVTIPGYGGVFRLNRKGSDQSVFVFNGTDGVGPTAGVLPDSERHLLYGTAAIASGGTVFQLDASGQEMVLHTFCSDGCLDGQNSFSGITEGQAGNLYGAAISGGAFGNGVIFQITQ